MRVIDLHCDTIYKCLFEQKNIVDPDLKVSFAKMPDFEKYGQFFAIFVPDELRGNDARRHVEKMLECYMNQLDSYPTRFIYSFDDPKTRRTDFTLFDREAPKTICENRCRPFLSIEGGAAIAGDINEINRLYDAGVMMMTLTWNGENELGSGSLTEKGLTEFGKAVVNRMNEVGMAVDVSHLNDRGFFDLCSCSDAPFCASHSNSRKICDNSRNLTDEQFCEITRRGGIVGIVLADRFIKDGGGAEFHDIFRHIYHFLELGGEKSIALGTDFDGTVPPTCVPNIAALGELYNYLIDMGVNESITDAMFFGNAANFFKLTD